MAKGLAVIQLDYAKAKQQADKLDQIARELEQTANDQLGNALSGINASWKSDTASSYIKKGHVVQEQLRIRAKDLRKSASTIREIAKNTYNADMNAYRIALERTFKK